MSTSVTHRLTVQVCARSKSEALTASLLAGPWAAVPTAVLRPPGPSAHEVEGEPPLSLSDNKNGGWSRAIEVPAASARLSRALLVQALLPATAAFHRYVAVLVGVNLLASIGGIVNSRISVYVKRPDERCGRKTLSLTAVWSGSSHWRMIGR